MSLLLHQFYSQERHGKGKQHSRKCWISVYQESLKENVLGYYQNFSLKQSKMN